MELLKQLDKALDSIDKTFQVSQTISAKDVAGLVTSALEGGSNYWYTIDDEDLADGISREDFAFPHIQIPFTEGCALIISNTEGDPDLTGKALDLKSMQKGLEIMSEKYPRHFSDFIGQNDDATTGDVFLQCCLFGEIVFG